MCREMMGFWKTRIVPESWRSKTWYILFGKQGMLVGFDLFPQSWLSKDAYVFNGHEAEHLVETFRKEVFGVELPEFWEDNPKIVEEIILAVSGLNWIPYVKYLKPIL